MTLHQLGMLRQRRGDRRTAETLLRQALTIRRAALGLTHPLTLETARELAPLTRVPAETPSSPAPP
jgi:hypothetical protein